MMKNKKIATGIICLFVSLLILLHATGIATIPIIFRHAHTNVQASALATILIPNMPKWNFTNYVKQDQYKPSFSFYLHNKKRSV